jgi:hypothetical protein
VTKTIGSLLVLVLLLGSVSGRSGSLASTTTSTEVLTVPTIENDHERCRLCPAPFELPPIQTALAESACCAPMPPCPYCSPIPWGEDASGT